MHISVDAVNVMAAYQPVVLACVHCGGRIETLSYLHSVHMSTRQVDMIYDSRLRVNKEIFIPRMHGANIYIYIYKKKMDGLL